MLTRKNIYHYILYVIFALIFFCGIGLYSVSLNPVSSDNGALLPMLIRYAIVFVAAALVVLIVKFVVPHIPEKYIPEKLPVFPKSIETIIIILVPVMMIFLRILVITSKIGEDINNIYYNYALNVSNDLNDTTFLSFAYASICRLLCKISTTPYPIYAFNALLQVGVAEFSYFALKKSLRIRYALLVFLLIAFLPFSINATMTMSPDALIAFLFSGYIYFLFTVNDLNTNGKITENYHLLIFAGLGLLSGFIAMCDILGISLFVVTITSLIMVYDREAYLVFQRRSIQILIYIISFIVFLFAFLYFVPNNGFGHLTNVFNYIFSFVPNGLSLTFNSPMETRYEGIVIFILSAVAIFAFIRNEADRGLFAVIVLDFAAVLTFVKFNTSEYAYLVNYFYVIFAAIGFFDAPGFLGEPEQVIIKRPVYARNGNLRETSNSHKISKIETVKTVPVRPSRPAPPTIPGRPVQPKEIVKQPEPVIGRSLTAEDTVKQSESANENIAAEIIAENTAVGNSDSGAIDEIAKGTQFNNLTENENIDLQPADTESKKISIINSDNIDTEITTEVSEVSFDKTEVSDINGDKNEVSVISDNKNEVSVPESETDKKAEVLTNDNEKRDNIVPSRREYKTAHVYKNKEEEEMHKMKVANEGISLVEADPNLKATAMIKNPLPTPKPHVTRELTYDYDLRDDQLDFDINDLKGKDYYDI